jgi:rod shape-determining protein MreD
VSPMMAVRNAAVVVVLVVLQFIVQPLMPWRVSPDFLIMAVLYGAVRMRPGWAAVLGFGIGLATDSLILSGFGTGALAMAVVGFGASWLKGMFFADNVAINAAFLFLGKWAFDIIVVVAQHQMSIGATLAQVFGWSILSALMTAVVGVVAMAILRPLGEEAPA